MKGAVLSTVHLPTVSLPTVRLTTVGWPSGNKGGGVTPPEPEDNAWLWGDGTAVLWGDGTTVLIEQDV